MRLDDAIPAEQVEADRMASPEYRAERDRTLYRCYSGLVAAVSGCVFSGVAHGADRVRQLREYRQQLVPADALDAGARHPCQPCQGVRVVDSGERVASTSGCRWVWMPARRPIPRCSTRS